MKFFSIDLNEPGNREIVAGWIVANLFSIVGCYFFLTHPAGHMPPYWMFMSFGMFCAINGMAIFIITCKVVCKLLK
jgi:hypothetical protein